MTRADPLARAVFALLVVACFAAFFVVLLLTGIRPGEALALRWTDVDGGYLRVQRAATPLRFAVDAVAGDARLVGDDRATGARQTIEESGLAHIGAADDDERW